MNIIYSHMNNTYTPDYPYLYGLFITPIALNISYKLINLLTYTQTINITIYIERGLSLHGLSPLIILIIIA